MQWWCAAESRAATHRHERHHEDDALSFSPEQVAHLRGHIASVTTGPEGLTFLYTAQHRRAHASAKVVERDSADVLIHAVAQIAADSLQVQCLSS